MSVQFHDEVVALTSREYRPFSDLDELLGVFLKAAVQYTHTGGGRIKVADFGDRRSKNGDLEVFVDNFQEKQPRDRILEHSPHLEAGNIGKVALGQGRKLLTRPELNQENAPRKTISTPIVYHEEAIGEVVSRPWETDMAAQAYLDFQNHFARELAFYIKRYQASSMARKSLGKNMLLVGSSCRIRRVDQFVERASENNLPVIVSGPFGSEKTEVVCAIHFNSPRCHLPLIEINCRGLSRANMAEEMQRSLEKVKGGTLFLNSVDEMPLDLQSLMPNFLESRLGQWLGGPAAQIETGPRVIASTTGELHELVDEGAFSRALLSELDFLRIRLAPLRERREDIPSLIAYSFEKYRCKPDQTIAAETMAHLQSYHWPDNLFEVERVVARLATLSEGNSIELEDLRLFAPQILTEVDFAVPDKLEPAVINATLVEEDPAPDLGEAHGLVKQMLAGEFSSLGEYHLGLQRAMRFLAKNFQTELSLSELAEQAFMSASHLSYLFKSELGDSFKTILTLIRIEKACHLLAQNVGMRVTDVSLEVGFGDLSHFTKTFKRLLGCNPKDYKRRHGH